MHGDAPTLRGRILDASGDPFPGLRVAVVDANAHPGALAFGRDTVAEDGTYAVPLGDAPRRHVRLLVQDPWGIRTVARSAPLAPGGPIPDLNVPRDTARGWRVPLDASPVTGGNRVDALVDGEAMFSALTEAVDCARRHVHLLQLFFEPGFTTVYGDGAPRTFAAALIDAARRGVDVRVLLNQNALLHDDVEDIRNLLEAAAGARTRVGGFLMSPNVMHNKLLLVDDVEAYVIGPPFQQRFWDTPAHAALEPRRATERPTHDLAMRLRGPAVTDAAEDFARYWNRCEPDDPVAVPPRPAAVGDHQVQLVRTYPRGFFDDVPEGSRGIRESYERMFVEAQHHVYLENQYYTSGTFNRLIDRALAAKPQLEVILVLNHEVDVPGYITWQKRRLRELGYPDRDRLGVFNLWRPRRRADGGVTLHRVYTHSKVALADDKWASVGTANLDSVSLERAHEFGIPFQSNVDLNVIVLDETQRTGFARNLRVRLWNEFLRLEPERLLEAPPVGWLPVWRRVAREDLQRLQKGDCPDEILVLPYFPDGIPVEGVDWK